MHMYKINNNYYAYILITTLAPRRSTRSESLQIQVRNDIVLTPNMYHHFGIPERIQLQKISLLHLNFVHVFKT